MTKDSTFEALQEEGKSEGAIRLLLSKEMTPNVNAFEKFGFSFKEEDEYRYCATLPKGWTYTLDDYQQKEGYIFDDKGRKRVKFCFEDKYIGDYPFMYTEMMNRFYILVTSDREVKVQTENGIKQIGSFNHGEPQKFNKLWKKASEYLDSIHPRWRDPTQYWSLD